MIDKNANILSVSEIKEKKLDLNDLAIIDSFSLSKENHKKGLIKSLIFSIIAILYSSYQ